MDTTLLTVAETVTLTGLGEATIWRWLRAGRLPRVTISDRSTRIPANAVEALAAELSRQDLLPVERVAELLNVSESMVWRLLRAGDLPRVAVGRRTCIPQEAVQSYIQRQTR